MQVEPVKKETLTEQVMSQLANKITSGELEPGERLPDERSLATMFGVTRSRIREALRALSLIGLIDIKPGGGSFVSAASGQIPRETILWSFHRELSNVSDLYDARRLIEGTVYLSCYDHRTSDVIDALQEYAERLLALDPANLDLDTLLELLDEIDTYVGQHCGNGIYAKLMDTMIVLRHDSARRILSVPASSDSAILWRTRILKAFNQDDRDAFATTVDNFFTNSVKQLTKF